MAKVKTVMMSFKQIAELERAGKLRYARPEEREQAVEKHVQWIRENGMKAEPSFPVGEYLGDLKVTNEMLASLTNINSYVNSIDQVKRGTYIVSADFDYAGDGKFLGLRLEPLREQETPEKQAVQGAERSGITGVFAQGCLQ